MEFRKAKEAEKPICTEILKDAFREYNFFHVYVDNPKRERIFFHTVMNVWMKNGFKNGTVLVGLEDNTIVSVAVLKAPKDKEVEFIDKSFQSVKMILAGGIRNTKAFLRMCEVSDNACHSLPEPKWHLIALAVSENHKGRGVGSSMLQSCIVPYVARHGGGVLTLNTNTEMNRLFYKKNGFEEFEELILHENGKDIGNWSYKTVVTPDKNVY